VVQLHNGELLMLCPHCGWDESGCCRLKNPSEEETKLRGALEAAVAIIKHKELRGMEALAFAHNIHYSDEFMAQCEAAWEKINAALAVEDE
jgi:hypothetical protein